MRPTIDQTLMDVARALEQRSTCARNHVGAVISLDGRIISTGYNGAPAGMAHCTHDARDITTFERLTPIRTLPVSGTDRGCREAIHAEANAISYAARHGVGVVGATAHVTLSPCYACSQLMIAAGLVRVVFDRSYRDPAGIDLLRRAGLVVDNMRMLNEA